MLTVRVSERVRNKCECVTGPQPERVQSIFAGVNATRTSETGPGRDRNGTGTGPERDRNGTGTGPEREHGRVNTALVSDKEDRHCI